MENEELGRVVAAAVGEALTPIVGAIGQLRNKSAERKLDQEEKKDELSPSTRSWLNNKATGGLGGKSLDAPTPHNPTPKTVDPGPKFINEKLTGKPV